MPRRTTIDDKAVQNRGIRLTRIRVLARSCLSTAPRSRTHGAKFVQRATACARFAAILLVILLSGNPCFLRADESSPEQSDPNRPDGAEIGLNADLKTLSALKAFRKSRATGSSIDLLDDFRTLQTSEAYSMVPADVGSSTWVPLYRALFREFYRLPARLQEQQAGRVSAAADGWLQEIMDSQELDQIPLLIQEAAGSEAALRAHILLARLHLDRQNGLAARVWLNPLLEDGVPARYRDAAVQMSREITEDDADRKAGGRADSPNRDSRTPSGIPSWLHWEFAPSTSAGLARQISTLQKAAANANTVIETTWSDEVDDEIICRKSMRGLVAIDMKTGKTRWQYPLIPALESSLTSKRGSTTLFRRPTTPTNPATLEFEQLQQSRLADAFCRDNVYGRISGDSEYVYLVTTDSESAAGSSSVFINPRLTGSRSTRNFRNGRVVALEKSTGRRIWSAGAEVFSDFLQTESDSCWIAGPPTASGRHLYCVIEWGGELHLASLSRQTGEVEWTALLAFPDQAITVDPVRRLWGAVPATERGLVWCPTTAGWTACVDTLTRSVIWSSLIRTKPTGAQSITIARGRPVAVTPPAHVSQRWPSSHVLRAGENLIVLPHESHEIAILNALDGDPVHRKKTPEGTVFVHADRKYLVYAEPAETDPRILAPGTAPPEERKTESPTLFCLDVQSGATVWTRTLASAEGFPTGRGTVLQNRILLPMSTGRIAAAELTSGDMTFSNDVVLPIRGWGHLLPFPASQSDLLYSAPDVLLRIASVKPPQTTESPVLLARVLMSSEKWEPALDALHDVTNSHPEFRSARKLRFEILRRLAAEDTDKWLEKFRESAETPEQNLHVQIVEIDWLKKQKKFRVAATRLADLLKSNSGLLAAANAADSTGEQPSESLPAPQRTLLSRVIRDLTELLDTMADDEARTALLAELPMNVLLMIDHVSVRSAIQPWLESAEVSETTIQAVLHSIRLAEQQDGSFADLQAESAALLRCYTALSSSGDESEIAFAGTQLLNALIYDLPAPVVEIVRGEFARNKLHLPDRQDIDNDFKTRLANQSALWTGESFEPVPVLRISSVGRITGRLTTVSADDLFLKQYQWSAVRGSQQWSVSRGSFGRLQAVRTVSPGERWSVPGIPDDYSVASGRTELLRRFGSLLILQTFRGIAAVSVLDQRVIWARNVETSTKTPITVSLDAGFREFTVGRDHVPSARKWGFIQILGDGLNWLCVRTPATLEIVETLTGSALWSVALEPKYNHIVATDDFVLATGNGVSEALCFNRRSGRRVDLPAIKDLAARTMTSSGRNLVCWKSAAEDEPAALQWVSPTTGTLEREVTLQGLQHFQFADDRTLAGFSSDDELLIVNLDSGEQQRSSFAVEDADSEPDEPDAAPRRFRITADALNYYVAEFPKDIGATTQQLSGRRMLAFQGRLRVVSRESGRLIWSSTGGGQQFATTDQPDLPLLILIDGQRLQKDNPASMATVFRIRGLRRTDGTEVFRHTIPSQSALRYLDIASTKPDSVDVAVNGQRVRMNAISDADVE